MARTFVVVLFIETEQDTVRTREKNTSKLTLLSPAKNFMSHCMANSHVQNFALGFVDDQ